MRSAISTETRRTPIIVADYELYRQIRSVYISMVYTASPVTRAIRPTFKRLPACDYYFFFTRTRSRSNAFPSPRFLATDYTGSISRPHTIPRRIYSFVRHEPSIRRRLDRTVILVPVISPLDMADPHRTRCRSHLASPPFDLGEIS